jgi:hypothetical protein
MNFMVMLLLGLLLVISIIWLTLLTLSLRQARKELRATKDRWSISSQELRRCIQHLDALREEVQHRIAPRVDRLEDNAANWRAPTPPLVTPIPELNATKIGQPLQTKSYERIELASDSPAQTGISHSTWSDEIVNAFNLLAASFDQLSRDEFVSRYRPEQCRLEGIAFRPQNGGAFWVLTEGAQSNAIILPSATVARDWDKFYRQMDGMHARDVLGGCFDISDGKRLRIETAAQGQRVLGQVELVSRGRLTGI